MKALTAKLALLLLSASVTIAAGANPVTVTLSKTCGLDMRLWQVGTTYTNVRINADKTTFSVNLPAGTEVCAYVNQNNYCSCWGYKYCEGPKSPVCPTSTPNRDLLIMIIGGCATISKDSNKLELPIDCDRF
jgi:hypothetical protein